MKHFWQNIDGWSQFKDQGVLLRRILPRSKHVRVAEVGVYYGRCTAMWVVELLNSSRTFDYYAIDHFRGSVEHDAKNLYEDALRNLIPILNKINILNMDSTEAARSFPDEHFDIVYIDASHDYESVKQDLNQWFPKVKTGGYLAGDDYIAGWPGVIAAVNEFLTLNSLSLVRVGSQQWATRRPGSAPIRPARFRRALSRLLRQPGRLPRLFQSLVKGSLSSAASSLLRHLQDHHVALAKSPL